MNYIVTNIRFAEDDYFALKEEAARKRISLSAVIREKVSKKKISKEAHMKRLLSLKTDWFTDKDEEGYKKIRKDMEKRLKRYNW